MQEHKCINEERLRKLEYNEGVMGVKMDGLIKELNNLTGWIKALVIMAIPCILTVFGYLVIYFIKNK